MKAGRVVGGAGYVQVGWERCGRGVGGADEAQAEWQRRGEGKAAGGVGGARRGRVFASLEFPKLANAQPSNFGPLPYFNTLISFRF